MVTLNKHITLLVIMAMLCGGTACDKNNGSLDQEQEQTEDNSNDGNSNGEADSPSGTGKDEDTDTSGNDDALDISEFTKTISIVWNGNDATITNGSKLSVSKDGAHVTIGAPGAEGQKVRINLQGSSSDGSLKIYNGVKSEDTNKKMLLCMDGVSLRSGRGPAINIQSGKTVFVMLADGSSNSLADAAKYTSAVEGEDAKGCFFSEKQLVFAGGSGSLSVEGNYKHAICVDDYFHLMQGNIVVSKAAGDGLHTNDYVQVDGGSINITSSGECIQCEELETGYYYQKGGEITLAGNGEKSGGIETALDIIIEGGKLDVTVAGAAAKCLKSDNNISLKGGVISLKTTGSGLYDATTKDTSAAACVRAENRCTIGACSLSCLSTGNGGKGINCYLFEAGEGADVTVRTTGGVYSYSSAKSRPKAIKATSLVTINGGSFNVTTTGTEGEGIESKGAVEINGGRIAVVAKDDGINAAGVITFNGGYTYVQSTGNDGIDTNNGKAGSIVVNGGVVIAHSANSPEEAFDADGHSFLTFNGGYVLGTGGQQGGGGGGFGGPGGGGHGGWGGGFGGGGSSTGSSPQCKQPTMMWSASASTGYFTVADSAGKVVMSCYVPRAMSSCNVMFSAPLSAGGSYKCGFSSSAPSGASEVFGSYFYADGTATSLSKSFTAPSGYGSI